jgi:hypothetical protein
MNCNFDQMSSGAPQRIAWRIAANRTVLILNERHLQTDLVGSHRASKLRGELALGAQRPGV